MNCARIYEDVFQKVHKDDISREANVIKKMQNSLVGLNLDLPEEVAKRFARVRSFIRIKYLRDKHKIEKMEEEDQPELKERRRRCPIININPKLDPFPLNILFKIRKNYSHPHLHN